MLPPPPAACGWARLRTQSRRPTSAQSRKRGGTSRAMVRYNRCLNLSQPHISCIKNTGRASALSYPTFYIAPRIDAIGPQVRGIGPSLPHWGWAAPFCWLKSGHMQTLCDAEIFSDSFVGWAITEMKNAASSGIPSAEAYFIMCARKYMSRTCSATFAPLFTAILRLVARRRRNVAVMANGWRDPIADTVSLHFLSISAYVRRRGTYREKNK